MYVHVNAETHGNLALDDLKLKLHSVVNHLMQVLGNKTRSSERAAVSLYCWAISETLIFKTFPPRKYNRSSLKFLLDFTSGAFLSLC